ncbi:MAG TPA: helix-turn-helix transcriptional regulator [Afifellaceae bacterium]|nr:helix-turn-helix transcriptional regulator [Afifellaceae bacterium]
MQAVTDFCDQPKQASAADLYIAGRLRIARKLARLSQEQLAEGIGITSQQIQKYERGVSRVSASRLYEMALIFGQPVAFFLPPSPRDEPAGATAVSAVFRLTDLMTAPETTNLITAFLRIKDAKTRRHFVALVRSIANDSE